MIESGIYIIQNIINNHIYIGCTNNFFRREKEHFSLLKNNKHHSQYLQNAYNKYGNEKFKFQVIDRVKNLSKLLSIELKYIETYKPLYNMTNKERLLYLFSDSCCPVCQGRLIIQEKSIVSFLKNDNTIRICENKFCYYEEHSIYDYEIKAISYI